MDEYKENVNNETNKSELDVDDSNQQGRIDNQIFASIFDALSLIINESNLIKIPEVIDSLKILFFINPKEFSELFCLNHNSEVIVALLKALVQDNSCNKVQIFKTLFSFLELITQTKEICMIFNENEIIALLSDYLLLGNCISGSFLHVIENLFKINSNSMEFISWILHIAETINKQYIDTSLSLLTLAVESEIVEETGIFSILMFLVSLLETNHTDQSSKYYELLHKILIKFPFVFQSIQVSRIIRLIIKGLDSSNIHIKTLSFDMISNSLSQLNKDNAIILSNFIKRESIISGLLDDDIDLTISVCNFLLQHDFILENIIDAIISENIIQYLISQIDSSSYEAKETIFNFVSKVYILSHYDIQNMILCHLDVQTVIDFCVNAQYSETLKNIHEFIYLVLKEHPEIRGNINLDDFLDMEIPDETEDNFILLINDLINENQ